MHWKNNTLTAVGLAIVGLGAAGSVAAQSSESSVLTSDEVRNMVDERTATVAAQRSALGTFLERPEVKDVAETVGIDIRRVQSAASALSDEEIRDLAPRLREAEAALAGGDTLVISSTAVIIALLIIILIIVA